MRSVGRRRREARWARLALRGAGISQPGTDWGSWRGRRYDKEANPRRRVERGSPRLRAGRSRLSLGLFVCRVGAATFRNARAKSKKHRGTAGREEIGRPQGMNARERVTP